jgi:uncharacterized membrane protein
MINKINRFQAREWFIITIIMLFITDLIIILDLPLLRDLIPFLFFTVVPGFLIISILKQHKIEFMIKTLLSVGLSVSLLLAVGLFLNSLYPLILQPLSLNTVLVSLNMILIIISFYAYQRNKNDFNTSLIFNFDFKLGDKLASPLIFPLLFPFMAILGTYLMNNSLNNVLLLTMLFLIPVYVVVVAFLKERIHPATYPVALFMIGLGLILMHALTSPHVLGRDVHQEFYCFQLTLANFHWNINDYYNPYNACLSITILPTIYQVLSNMNPEYVFKLVFGLLGSILPLMVYTVAKKYLNKKFAFFASILFVFQVFLIDIVGAVRQEVAIIFFFLAVIVIFDCFGETKFERSGVKKLLFLIFVSSMVVSHYATSYVAFALLVPILLLPFLRHLYYERKLKFINFEVLIIYLFIIIIWFMLYAKVQFLAGSEVIQTTVAATVSANGAGGAEAFMNSREGTVLSILGLGIKNIPNLIAVIVNDLIFLTMGIGLITLMVKYRKILQQKTVYVYEEIRSLDSKLVLGGLLSLTLLAMFVILPSISFFYGSDRLFFQLLIFTVPIFIIGAFKITELLNKVIKKSNLKVGLILVLLIALFICNTHLQYEFTGIPFSPEYDKTGITRGELYIYNGELAAAQWIGNYRMDDVRIYSDAVGFPRMFIANTKSNVVGINFNNKTINGYIYMGNANINEGKFYDTIDSQVKVQRFNYFFNNKSRLFDDGYGQIWS